MRERFLEHLQSHHLVPEGATVVVGYSGGADSTCLLHLLVFAGVDVVAAHLHHGLRDEADLEMRLCEAFATELGVAFIGGRAKVAEMARDLKVGLEEAGRKARYTFLSQAAYQVGADRIATAHTRSDHIETVLLNLTRGAGLTGISGIPLQRGNLIRPLRIFSREEAREYCESEGLWFHDDPANTDLSFTRARIRHRVVPELRSINPSLEDAIGRLADVAEEEDQFLNGMAAAALEQCEVLQNGALAFLTHDCEVAFDRGRLSHLPSVPFVRAVRLAAEALGGGLTFTQTRAVRDGVASGGKGAVTADGGEVVVEWDEETIRMRTVRPSLPYRYPLTVPGETESDEFGWRFTAFEADGPGELGPRSALEVAVNARNLKGALFFRNLQPGDAMRPAGFTGTRKLSDLMGEAHLTTAARARLPIVCDLVGPVWAPGICLDERARPSAEAGRHLVLRFGPVSGE